MHMRTTLNIDEAMMAEAMRLTGFTEKTAVVHAGLQALIRRESTRRLIALGFPAAAQITLSIARECEAREAAARAVMGGFDLRSKPGSMHVWVNLPEGWSGDAFARAAAERHVRVRPARQFAADGTPSPPLLAAQTDRLSNWRQLQELAGGRPGAPS